MSAQCSIKVQIVTRKKYLMADFSAFLFFEAETKLTKVRGKFFKSKQ